MVKSNQNQTYIVKRVSLLVFSIMMVILGFQLYQGQKPAEVTFASIQTTPRSESEIPVCETDADCMLVTKQCCACDQGGQRKAINRKYYSYWFNKKTDSCIFASCPNIVSQDMTCLEKAKAKCVNTVCQVKP